MTTVFVYGSLLSGEPNHPVMRGAELVRTTTTIAGFTLHDLGPYPALLAEGETAIEGELYRVSARVLARLDRFEDHPRLYRRAPIALACGTDACAYFFVDEALARRHLALGASWRAFRQRGKLV